MPRPPKARTISHEPAYTLFKPAGVPARQLSEVLVSIDEFEALRLKDLVGWDQERCAAAMGVSQSTLQRTLASARAKITDALVHGRSIRIEGGRVEFASAAPTLGPGEAADAGRHGALRRGERGRHGCGPGGPGRHRGSE